MALEKSSSAGSLRPNASNIRKNLSSKEKTLSVTIDGKTYCVADEVYIQFNDKGVFLAQIHAINESKQTVKVRWSKGTYTEYEFSEVAALFNADVAQVLKPVTLDGYFDDINEIARCVPGGLRDTDEWAKTKVEDALFFIQDGIEWNYACSENEDDFDLYTLFKYYE